MIQIAIALLALVPMSNTDARVAARDSAPVVTEMRVTKTRVGHCEIRGSFARCFVRAWAGGRRYCRYVAHVHRRGEHFDVRATGLECWE